MKDRRSVLFYCQHAMGMGHVVRSLTLAKALANEFRVVLLNGGELPNEIKVPSSIKIKHLPPLAFRDSELVSLDARYTLTAAKKTRTAVILDTLNDLKPDILLTELFPFGRRKFEFELLPLLESAKPAGRKTGSLIVCSLRDILVTRQEKREKFERWAISLANRYFDLILVHSDPRMTLFEQSFPTTQLKPHVHHTGFVFGERSSQSQSSDRHAIVVSAGGGLYGYELLSVTMEAHRMLGGVEKPPLKIITGPFIPPGEFNALSDACRERQDVELIRSIADLYDELRTARTSISQCGYNTALEILQAGIPALVVPFAHGAEDEQMIRAQRLKKLGAVRMLDPKHLSVSRMAREMQNLLDWEPHNLKLNVNGARCSAEILKESMDHRPFEKSFHRTASVVE
jgi:predicted glycosyltransferase